MHRLTKLPQRGVYAITDGPRPDLFAAVESALRGGAAIVQYRDKTNDGSRRFGEASALLAICRNHGVPLVVNDDVDLAAEIRADGLHLGEGDVDIAHARLKLGAETIVGVSCYDSLDRAKKFAEAGADYLAFGSFFASPTKPHARRATIDLLKAARTLNLPLVAIGGITPDNAQPLLDAGANFFAVISGIFASTNIDQATRRYAQLFSDDKH